MTERSEKACKVRTAGGEFKRQVVVIDLFYRLVLILLKVDV